MLKNPFLKTTQNSQKIIVAKPLLYKVAGSKVIKKDPVTGPFRENF